MTMESTCFGCNVRRDQKDTSVKLFVAWLLCYVQHTCTCTCTVENASRERDKCFVSCKQNDIKLCTTLSVKTKRLRFQNVAIIYKLQNAPLIPCDHTGIGRDVVSVILDVNNSTTIAGEKLSPR